MADVDAIARRWSRDGGMGNDRSADDYTDAGCRILAQQAFVDVNDMLDALHSVQGIVATARAISPGQRMVVYAVDLEAALGHASGKRPHKLGQNEEPTDA